jgi:CarD family transcriptional regulator
MVASKPILVKMPENQNFKARTTAVATVRPPVTVNKLSDSAQVTAVGRPVYRPIQVINKPLTPLQPVRQMAPVAKSDEKVEFKKGDFVVYPAHGVGEIEAVETQIIGGMEIKLYAIAFEKDRMRLKVPVFKAQASGLRRLSNTNRMQDALKTLQGRAHIRRAMWSRRAQEYETKINSGDPVSIAEVLRDLKRSNDESEQSYSERQIYQSALERLAREVAAVEKITEIEAAERLEVMIRGKRARAASVEEPTKDVASA